MFIQFVQYDIGEDIDETGIVRCLGSDIVFRIAKHHPASGFRLP